jgi:signal transduction histidine kinase
VKLRSLRARLIVGTIVWVVIILTVSICVGFTVMQYHPQSALLIHNSFIIIIGVTLATAGVSVIRRGLSPFAMLQERLADVRSGRTSRLEGEYPTEVESLVQDLNVLLEDRERRVAQAAAKAGDLAHGLKTPLAILTQEIDRARAAGQTEFAITVREQVDRMRRQIDSHLAQARATAGGSHGARASVADAAQAIVRTMQRLYVDRALTFAIDTQRDIVVRVPLEDLEELLGNLLDNACKWARSRVHLSAVQHDRMVTITVDDDGAGLEPGLRMAVLQRGVRADEKAPGSGLGLAIVRDLAEAYGGAIVLEESVSGGLRARLTLPTPEG